MIMRWILKQTNILDEPADALICSANDFAQRLRPLLKLAFPPIDEVVICLLLDFEVAELARHLPELECIPPFSNSLTH